MQTQQIFTPNQPTPAELKQLIQTAFYAAWESGMHNGEGKPEAARAWGQKADTARKELFEKLGIPQ